MLVEKITKKRGRPHGQYELFNLEIDIAKSSTLVIVKK
jgi:hypothetical protein